MIEIVIVTIRQTMVASVSVLALRRNQHDDIHPKAKLIATEPRVSHRQVSPGGQRPCAPLANCICHSGRLLLGRVLRSWQAELLAELCKLLLRLPGFTRCMVFPLFRFRIPIVTMNAFATPLWSLLGYG
jgi:hypothetical protein